MSTTPYIFGQGKLYVFDINPISKLPMGNGRFLGNVPDQGFIVTPTTAMYEHRESTTGQRLSDLVIESTKDVKGTLIIEEFNKENMALTLYGTPAVVSSATVTAETKTAVKSSSLLLNNINLSSFTSLTNSAGSTTYVKGTDYNVDLSSGTVDILSAGAIADNSSVKANYAFLAHDSVGVFSTFNKYRWLRFNGINTADENSPVIVDICKMRIMPAKSLNFIQDNEITKMDCDISCLYEPELAANTDYRGGFMRIRKVP